MVDLNARIPAAAQGWRGLNNARAINNAGQIVLSMPCSDATAPIC